MELEGFFLEVDFKLFFMFSVFEDEKDLKGFVWYFRFLFYLGVVIGVLNEFVGFYELDG